jgi:hypothetical protein
MTEMRNADKILFGKPERKSSLRRPRSSRENNIKMVKFSQYLTKYHAIKTYPLVN